MRLVIVHSPTDASDFITRNPMLFREKTLGVVLMGGVTVPELGEHGTQPYLVPDMAAQNNIADPKAAEYLVKTCQDLTVPLTVVSRHLAFACRFPRTFYDAMSRDGGTLGKTLGDCSARASSSSGTTSSCRSATPRASYRPAATASGSLTSSAAA